MGEKSNIAWTDATFNPWWGCTKVSPGCVHCYAETLDKRIYPKVVEGEGGSYTYAEHWGANGKFRFFGDGHWNEVYKWNEQAAKSDKPFKVFCGSMCDVFQNHPDLVEPRKRLFNLIEDTDSLTWLLLTKRPENIETLLPKSWIYDETPDNVWLGVTVEDQAHVNRIAQMGMYSDLFSGIFVSVEPMLGPVSLTEFREIYNWVIIGGESGAGFRPMLFDWFEPLIKECQIDQVPVFFKQFGGWPDKGDDVEKHPALKLMPREFPLF